MITAKDVQYVRDQTGFSITRSQAMALLLDHDNIDIRSEEANKKMISFAYTLKAERFAEWLTIKELADEFGPFN